ncbi:MAG: hypothetical protein HC785_27005 [Calothrix sp. CSU_2_0]|nr:hypothetical protein [Calothrix sp. CSU_2_0]
MITAKLLRSWMRGNFHVQFCRRVKESDFFFDSNVNLARTPMIILIAVTMGDILANLIIGGGTGTTTGG